MTLFSVLVALRILLHWPVPPTFAGFHGGRW